MYLKRKIFDYGKRILPAFARKALRAKFSLEQHDLQRRIDANPYAGVKKSDKPGSPFVLGIIEEVTQYHQHYIAACEELDISYRVLSILSDNWIQEFRESGCDGYLVWPSCFPSTNKIVFDDRLYILAHELNACIFPTWKECWLTEYKPRLRDWLLTHEIPHPQTWVFHNQQAAIQFAHNCGLPKVIKTATGAAASGVSIARTRSELMRGIKLAFGKGLRPTSFPPNDRQRGYAFLQEYYPNVKEWRMVKMGEYYFGHMKGAGIKGLHSGSKDLVWADPGSDLLDLTRRVAQAGDFKSMAIDVFETESGQYLVNECQTVFGCSVAKTQMKIDGKIGAYERHNGVWKFVEGDRCRNHLCNLRVEILLEKLGALNPSLEIQ